MKKGSWEIECTLAFNFTDKPPTCSQCPAGWTDAPNGTVCMQTCPSNDDPRDFSLKCLYAKGNIPNGYHCTDHKFCDSGLCQNNKCISRKIHTTLFLQKVSF